MFIIKYNANLLDECVDKAPFIYKILLLRRTHNYPARWVYLQKWEANFIRVS